MYLFCSAHFFATGLVCLLFFFLNRRRFVTAKKARPKRYVSKFIFGDLLNNEALRVCERGDQECCLSHLKTVSNKNFRRFIRFFFLHAIQTHTHTYSTCGWCRRPVPDAPNCHGPPTRCHSMLRSRNSVTIWMGKYRIWTTPSVCSPIRNTSSATKPTQNPTA